MDFLSFLLSLTILKNLPGEAVADAEAAAEIAEASAEIAQQHSMGVSVSGTTITFAPPTGT